MAKTKMKLKLEKDQKINGLFLFFQSFMGDQDAPRGKAAYHLLWLKELTELEKKNYFRIKNLLKIFQKKTHKKKKR